MCGSSGSTTTNNNSQPPQQVLNAYTNLINAATNQAQQPLNQYSGSLVAGFTPQQQQAFGITENAAGAAQPYINSAAQEFGQATTPLYDTVSQYQSPYTQDVTQATQNLFNQQNATGLSQVSGSAASQGALGGDRTGVAQAQYLANANLGQGQTLANVEQQGYQTALGADEANSWLNSQAGFGLGQLGSEAQSTELQGASALLQTGGLQQSLAQEQLNIPYEEFQAQQSYPYQQLSWLGGLTEGIGSQTGGTSSSTTTPPAPNTGSEVMGAALTLLPLAAMALARGGRARRADGGLATPSYDAGGLVAPTLPTVPTLSLDYYSSPNPQITPGRNTIPNPEGGSRLTGNQNQQQTPQQDLQTGQQIAGLFGGSGGSGGALGGLGITGDTGLGATGGGYAGLLGGDAAAGYGVGASGMSFADMLDSGMIAMKEGGRARLQGGGASPLSAATGPMAASPNVQNYYQQLTSMPTEKLQELAVRFPPQTQQGQMVQRALQAKRMQPANQNAQPQQMQATGTTGLAPPQQTMADGGFVRHFASGGGGTVAGGASPSGLSFITGGNGVAIPQISQSAFTPNTASYGAGQGTPGWFNPLPQVQNTSPPIVTQMPQSVLNSLSPPGPSAAAASSSGSYTNPFNGQQLSVVNGQFTPAEQAATGAPGPGALQFDYESANGQLGGMRRGGRIGFDDGGDTAVAAPPPGATSQPAPPTTGPGLAAPIPSDAAPMDMDQQPIVDHSGDTVKVHYPSEKKSLDLGIPSDPNASDTHRDNLLMALSAAGAGMLASGSPYAGVNIGRGIQQGLQTYVNLPKTQADIARTQAEAESAKQDAELKGLTVEGYRRLQGLGGGSPQGAAQPSGPGATPVSANVAPPVAGSPRVAPLAVGNGPQPTSAADMTPIGALASKAPTIAQGTPTAPRASGQAEPLLDLPSLYHQYQIAASTPGMQSVAAQILSTIEKATPSGMVMGQNGVLYNRAGYINAKMQEALTGKGMVQTPDGGWAFPQGYVAANAGLEGAKTAAEAANKNYELKGPGAMLVNPRGGVIAQSPQPITRYNPATQRMETSWQYLNPREPGVPQGAPAAGAAPPPSGAPGSGAASPPPAPLPLAYRGAQAPQPEARGAVDTGIASTSQGLPSYAAGPSALEKASQEHYAATLEKYGADLQTNAQNAEQGNFLIDQMRSESKTWNMDKFANFKGEAQSYLQAIADQFGIKDPALTQSLGDYQAFSKNAMEIMRQTTRATSSRAAVQEMQLIQRALPQATMSRQGFSEIADQLQGINDYHIAKQQAADAWRQSHNNTLSGFESDWNKNLTPSAFLLHRMDEPTFKAMAANLQKTPEGRATLSRALKEMRYAQDHGLFGGQ